MRNSYGKLKSDINLGLWGSGTVLGGLIIAVLIYIAVFIPIKRDINDQIQSSQMSTTNTEETITALQKLKVNMAKRKMTQGYAALINKSEANDMAKLYKRVGQGITYLQDAQKMDPTSDAYSTALDNARGAINAMTRPAQGWFWARNWWWIAILVLADLGILAIITFKLRRKTYL